MYKCIKYDCVKQYCCIRRVTVACDVSHATVRLQTVDWTHGDTAVLHNQSLNWPSACWHLQRTYRAPGSVFSYKLRYIVGFGLVEMVISTNPKPTIHRNLYENTAPDHCQLTAWDHCSPAWPSHNDGQIWASALYITARNGRKRQDRYLVEVRKQQSAESLSNE